MKNKKIMAFSMLILPLILASCGANECEPSGSGRTELTGIYVFEVSREIPDNGIKTVWKGFVEPEKIALVELPALGEGVFRSFDPDFFDENGVTFLLKMPVGRIVLAADFSMSEAAKTSSNPL